MVSSLPRGKFYRLGSRLSTYHTQFSHPCSLSELDAVEDIPIEKIEVFEGSARSVPEFIDKSIKELIEGNHQIIFSIQSDQIEVVRF